MNVQTDATTPHDRFDAAFSESQEQHIAADPASVPAPPISHPGRHVVVFGNPLTVERHLPHDGDLLRRDAVLPATRMGQMERD